MKRFIYYLSIIIIPLLIACSASQFGWKEVPEEGSNRGNSGNLNEDFDPLTLNDDDIVIVPPKPSRIWEPEKLPETPDTTGMIAEAPKWVQGYRIQILTTSNMDRAREERKKAVFRFSDNVDVYLDFEAPNYKLRIGDCVDLKEADQLLNEAIRLGYKDAWKVPLRVLDKSP